MLSLSGLLSVGEVWRKYTIILCAFSASFGSPANFFLSSQVNMYLDQVEPKSSKRERSQFHSCRSVVKLVRSSSSTSMLYDAVAVGRDLSSSLLSSARRTNKKKIVSGRIRRTLLSESKLEPCLSTLSLSLRFSLKKQLFELIAQSRLWSSLCGRWWWPDSRRRLLFVQEHSYRREKLAITSL